MTTMTDFATTLRAERKRLGYTQLEMATRLGVQQMRLSRWERGAHCPDPIVEQSIRAAIDALLA